MSGEVLLLNAAIGGITSAATGNDPLKGALLGAVGGGIASQIPALAGAVPGAGSTATSAAPAATGSVAGTAIGASPTAGQVATQLGVQGAGTAAGSQAAMLADQLAGFGAQGLQSTAQTAAGAIPASAIQPSAATAAGTTVAQAPITTDKGMFGGLKDWWGGLSGKEKLMYGGAAGIGSLMLAERMGADQAPSGEYKGPLRKYKFDPFGYNPSVYAGGGITSLAVGGGYDKMVGDMPMYASGGISDLGSYSDGGRMLRGPGDGMSDNIPGVIGGKRPARLADGEFVVPADVVSHLGNGSTDAGAKQLYAMMDRVRAKRTGTKRQGRQINPKRMMPA
jgi:hypothetical protein